MAGFSYADRGIEAIFFAPHIVFIVVISSRPEVASFDSLKVGISLCHLCLYGSENCNNGIGWQYSRHCQKDVSHGSR